ncbi:hypothetical protein GE061_016729 [Apolygus lucorum]|uniref:Uncharacterized protein n=1 Tax=Apolygus lucorum TaxID=248454 RepID=A0A6A4JF00_APOLU|nr:hypothetical protein GE061_016729 [Apolygus lucorum]
MGPLTLFSSILLGLVGWGISESTNDSTEDTIMLRNHLLPGVDYERDRPPAQHLVLVTNSEDGRPPVYQLDTVHMNMEEQYGVLGVVLPPSRNQNGQRNPDGQRNPGGQRNPSGNRRNPQNQRNQDGQENQEGQRNPSNRRNPNRRASEQNRNRIYKPEDVDRFNWWNQV